MAHATDNLRIYYLLWYSCSYNSRAEIETEISELTKLIDELTIYSSEIYNKEILGGSELILKDWIQIYLFLIYN